MAKSTTVVREEKQSPQPDKALTKAKVADKLAERGQESPGQGNQIVGTYTRRVISLVTLLCGGRVVLC
jgi:hypothetical protein